jgi:fumarate reductase flavoprotein subunit
VIAPPGRTRPGLDWEGRGGDVLLRTLEARLMTHGGRLLRGERADELLMEDGRCVGIATRIGTRFTGRAVVLADGGFQGDLELVRTYITPEAEKLRQRGAGTGLGDGLRMATAVGAALIGLDRFYGHLLSVDALHNDQLWPYPYVDAVATAGIVVGRDGCRFADEGNGGVFLANAVARLDDPLSAMMIGDESIWQGPGRQGLIPANPHLPNVGGTMHQADTLAQLANVARLPAAALTETIAGYNAALQAGTLGQLQPHRTPNRYKPMPITQPPFFAVPMCAGITNTMGGIAINGHGQVLNRDETPISGLYAVGATTGGLEGGPAVGYVGGLVKGVVFGIRAAEHIAAGSPRG